MSKNIFLYFALVITFIFIAGFIYTQYLKPELDSRTVVVTTQMPVVSTVAPLQFKFPSGPDALALIEPPTGDVTETGIKEVYLLMDNKQYLEFSKEEGVPPATISVFVLPYVDSAETDGLKRAEKLRAWAVANPQFSSWGAATTEPQSVEVDGVRAIAYKTESVYKQNVYVTLYNDDVYVFTGQYEKEGDTMQQMFTEILAEVILT